ncbi:MAG: sigma factor-like helix-turn-helix DNA-binding protein [Acidobacteriota bacterium]
MREIIATCGLNTREENVIKLHFGIDCEPHSLAEIAKMFDLPAGAVEQIQAEALRKLRHRWLSHRMENYAANFTGILPDLMEATSSEHSSTEKAPPPAAPSPGLDWELSKADRSFLRGINIKA